MSNSKLTWKNEQRRLGELLPQDNNPRFLGTDERERLSNSWRLYGQVETMAISPEGLIYNGHQRYALLLEQHGPDFVVDVRVSSRPLATEEWQELTVLLHDGTVGNWDIEKMAEWGVEVSELAGWGIDPYALELLEAELAAMGISGGDVEDPGAEVDKADELQQKWQVQHGQVWWIRSQTMPDQSHYLMCGNSANPDDTGKLMAGQRAQLGLTSPPYAVGKEYEVDVSFSQHVALLRSVADRALEVIVPGGFWFINFGEIASQAHSSPLTGSDRQCLYLMSLDYWQICHVERGMDLYAARVWYKPFNRLQQPFWTYHTSIPHHQEWEHLWTWRLPGGDSDQCYDWDISGRAVWDTRAENTEDRPLTRHVAAFPICLPLRAIKAHSAPGSAIWEPFCGSGTTLVACEMLGRIGYGMEIGPKYCAVTLERLHTMGLEVGL